MAKKAKQPTREELTALATEMNAVMGLEPPIKISKKLDDEGLIEKIKEEAEGQIYASDFEEDPEDSEKVVFSDEAAATLKALGIEVAEDEEAEESASDDEEEIEEEEEEEEKPAKKGAKGKKVEEPEEEEPEDGEEEEEPKPKKGAKGKKEEPKPAKGKGKKVVEEEPEEEEEEEEKPAKKAAKGVKEAPKAKGKSKAKAEPKKGKKIKYSRSQALVDALKSFKKGATKKEIVEKSDELYVAQGGDSGMYVSEVMFRYTIPALLLLEAVELNDGKYKLV